MCVTLAVIRGVSGQLAISFHLLLVLVLVLFLGFISKCSGSEQFQCHFTAISQEFHSNFKAILEQF